jgi:hypothetical protein
MTTTLHQRSGPRGRAGLLSHRGSEEVMVDEDPARRGAR